MAANATKPLAKVALLAAPSNAETADGVEEAAEETVSTTADEVAASEVETIVVSLHSSESQTIDSIE